MKKYAVIDIGSNSVRLMLWADGALYKKVETTRLSEGLSESGVLSEAAMKRSERAVAAFCEEGRRAGAQPVAFATAAVRSASNGGEFCARVRALCGLDIDVVAGEDEAQMGLLGALGANDGAVIWPVWAPTTQPSSTAAALDPRCAYAPAASCGFRGAYPSPPCASARCAGRASA